MWCTYATGVEHNSVQKVVREMVETLELDQSREPEIVSAITSKLHVLEGNPSPKPTTPMTNTLSPHPAPAHPSKYNQNHSNSQHNHKHSKLAHRCCRSRRRPGVHFLCRSRSRRDQFCHRIVRAGRVGQQGQATSFLTGRTPISCWISRRCPPNLHFENLSKTSSRFWTSSARLYTHTCVNIFIYQLLFLNVRLSPSRYHCVRATGATEFTCILVLSDSTILI